jgi:hypothetical protein
VVESSSKIWATSVIYKKQHKINNRPIGENLPNLVTLFGTEGREKKMSARNSSKKR